MSINHAYCPKCGHPLVLTNMQHRFLCKSKSCNQLYVERKNVIWSANKVKKWQKVKDNTKSKTRK